MPKSEAPSDWQVIARFALGRLAAIRDLIEEIDRRAEEVDGPVTPTVDEITPAELRKIFALSNVPRRMRAPAEIRA